MPAEAERTGGTLPFRELLKLIHAELEPERYLEIGVRKGISLSLARCMAIGVDPHPQLAPELDHRAHISAKTSDDFFREDGAAALGGPIDFAFIDGMHLFEYALRDFINVEQRAHPASLVAIDDIFPCHPIQARRLRESRLWTGDVWKLVPCLQRYRPDLLLVPLDTAPTGMLLVAGLAPDHTALAQSCDQIVEEFTATPHEVPQSVLDRSRARAPDPAAIAELCRLLRTCRQSRQPRAAVRNQLAAWRS